MHRKCYDDGLSNSRWARIRQTFACTVCEAGSRVQHFDSNYCSDGEWQLVIEENLRSYDPPTIQYEMMIGTSETGAIVDDGCGYKYVFHRDYPSLRVWRYGFRVWNYADAAGA